jgi:TRAP-type uncharacterized transport system fused permease subunit
MAAHLFCFYFGILADDTPPVGLAAYAAAAIAKSPPIATGHPGLHVRYPYGHPAVHVHFQCRPDPARRSYSWPQGLLIFLMACLGNFAFASATQGWFVARNKIWEIPFFLAVT